MSDQKTLPIGDVVLFNNGMVMVFDLDGKQMNSFEGRASAELADLITKYAPTEARFWFGEWAKSRELITREAFVQRCAEHERARANRN